MSTRVHGARTTQGVGAAPARLEDDRLLTGKGRFLDDIGTGALEVAFVRSQHAHAKIRDVDVSAVLDLDGIVGVYGWEDLPSPTNHPLPVSMPHPGLHSPRTQYALAREEVNHVGEPILMVVARDRYQAEDACSAVIVDYAPLPACVDLSQSVRAEVAVHDDIPDNVAGVVEQGSPDVEEALERAPHRLDLDLWIERSMASPLEGRGVLAQPDPVHGRMLLYTSTQVPHAVRAAVAHMTGQSPQDLDVICPDVGGAFGVKGVRPWPEEVLIAWASMHLQTDVRWTEDRYEHFVGSAQERGQRQRIDVGFDAAGKVLAYDAHIDHDIGAYSQYGLVVSQNTSSHLLGPYAVPTKRVTVRALYTNTVMIAPYRGAGRPEAVFAMERTMDAIADHLNMDRAEVRRRNFVQPEQMPYPQGVNGQDGREVVYDSGDYPQSLDKLLKLIDWEGVPQLKEEARAHGRRVGVGLACYVENTGLGPYEGATVTAHPDGTVSVSTGLTTHGQGHATSFAQIVAQELGVTLENVIVTTGSTRAVTHSAGTYASRGAVVSGTAIAMAARDVRERALTVAAQSLEVDVADLELHAGTIRVRGNPSTSLELRTVAVLANPLKYGFVATTQEAIAEARGLSHPSPPEPGQAPGLNATRYFSPEGSTFASGMHAALVETDPDTAEVKILRYCVVHDCGTMINPTIVEGQVHGGVAQGIGGALYERMHYDDNGQLLNASFMDFLMPYATEVPHIETDHLETPSPLNPLGIKGAGEAGVIPVSAVLASAIEDAEKLPIRRMPLSPSDLFTLRTDAT